MIEYRIRMVNNGYILEMWETTEYEMKEDGTVPESKPRLINTFVFSEDESKDVDLKPFTDLLWMLNEQIGPRTSKYSKERLAINIEKGSCYEEK